MSVTSPIGLALAALLAGLSHAEAAAFSPVAPATPTLPSPFAAAPSVAMPTLRSAIDPQGSDEAAPVKPGGDAAFGAFQRGYFATALTEAMKRLKANPKDGAAMALVGEIYSQGLAVRPNLTEAAKWDQLGADQGNREATFAYGMALLQGKGVPKDAAKAKVYLQRAAEAGHAGAMYNLGVLAINAHGDTHNFGVAGAYFRHAMEAGDIDATAALAELYKGGMGVALDLRQAAQLFKQAADRGHAGAEVEYAIMLFNGEGVEKSESEAAKYFIKAAYLGNPIAEDRLARLYAAGRGVPQSAVEAARWHVLAHAAGVKDAWLDDQMAGLGPAEKLKVEDILKQQLGR